MQTITHYDLQHGSYTEQHSYTSGKSLWHSFITYAEGQEKDRFWWMVLGILGHGTIFTIITLALVMLLGNIFVLYIIACCAMVMVVIINLAAMPTKYTIPVFYLSLIIDLGVIISAIILH